MKHFLKTMLFIAVFLMMPFGAAFAASPCAGWETVYGDSTAIFLGDVYGPDGQKITTTGAYEFGAFGPGGYPGDCRGWADAYEYHTMGFSLQSGTGTAITFKLYECATGKLYDVTETYTYVANDQQIPFDIHAVPPDSDSDGITDFTDNCPNVANPDQADAESDGVGDVCDVCPGGDDKADADSDGTPDFCDVCTDTDSDGYGNPGYPSNTCPEDGCPSDPLKNAAGVCGCGVADTDTDSDGTPDCTDGCDTDPLKVVPGACGCGVADTDTDSDGTPDCNDECDTDPLKVVPGACGCGVADTDTDSDGTPDCNDGCDTDPLKVLPGACGCGVADTDTDSDGTPNCDDNCPNDAGKTEAGQCGCGTEDTDSDSDGVADCIDNDNDGDGLMNDCDPNDDDATGANGANGDADSDGFSNHEECNLAETDPEDPEEFPGRPEVTQTIPSEGTTVPKDASVVVRVKDDDPGIDPESGNLNVMVGATAVSGTFDVKPVFDEDPTEYWYIFRPYTPFGYGATVNVTLDGVTDEDGIGLEDDPYGFTFQIETADASDSAADWADSNTVRDTTDPNWHTVTATGSDIEGAQIVYSAEETVLPRFVPNDNIPELDLADGAGVPVAMEPPTVFEHPVTLFIPTGGADPATLRIYYYSSAEGWVAACDINGNVLPGGQGWMDPGSRVNHDATDLANPNTIEIKVWHFSAVQAGLDECPNDPNKTDAGQCGCGNLETDTDSDGTADCVDGCDNDPNKIAAGDCGCGTPDTDADSNGIADCNDGGDDDDDDNWWEKICFISSVM